MRIKAAIIIIIGFIVAATFRFIAITAIDAPHNASNDIDCPSCHAEGLLGELIKSPFWGGNEDAYNKMY